MDRHLTRRARTAGLGAIAAVGLLAGVACTNPGTGTIGKPCTDVELVVARGTSEPGTLGVIVGDPLLAATRTAIAPRTVAGHPVAYPAGFGADSAPTGNRATVDHITKRAAACAATKFVLVGYSQGAQVVNMALGADTSRPNSAPRTAVVLPASLSGRIAAVVLYGNPNRALGRTLPEPYASRTLDICATGDPVCQPDGGDIAAHLTYAANARQAAAFIRTKAT